jgi:hypothetical protein
MTPRESAVLTGMTAELLVPCYDVHQMSCAGSSGVVSCSRQQLIHYLTML